jgi:hypothetical protein
MRQFQYLFLLLLISSPSFGFGKKMTDKRPDAAAELLSAFQGTCGSQGAATAAASAQTNLLVTLIETLKSTDACKPYVSSLSQIQTAATQIQALQSSPAYASYQTDQNEIQVLTLALQNTSATSSEYVQIQNTIQTVQNQMYTDQATYNYAKQSVQNSLLVSNSASMLSFGQQMIGANSSTSATTLDQCLAQSPIAALELGSNLLAYGGTFLPAVFGAGVSGIAQLFNLGAEMFRDGQYDAAITEAEADQMPDALNCALESMTDSYCTVSDSYSLVELARENRAPDYTALPLWKGIDLLGRQLPALLNWLQQIENGVPPQQISQATTQIGAINELLNVQEVNLSAIAGINTAIAQYNSISDPSIKNSVLINGIATSALSMAGISTVNGAMAVTSNTDFNTFQASPFVWACWLVNGYTPYTGWDANCPNPGVDNPTSGLPSQLQMADYASILTAKGALLPQILLKFNENWKSAEIQVEALANSDFARVIVTNAVDLISDARENSNGNPLSARQVLANIDAFIQSMIDYNYSGNPQLPVMLSLEKAKIDEAIQQIDGTDANLCPPMPPTMVPGHTQASSAPAHQSAAPPAISPEPSPSPSPSLIPVSPEDCENRRLVRIFTIFGLQNGTQGLSTEIQDLVNTDLQNRFQSGEFPKSKTDLLKTAGSDLYVRLAEVGLGDLGALTDDLNSARGDYETNIRAFREFFENAFEQALEHEAVLTQGEIEANGPNRPHGQKLAQLCMFWLFTANIPGSKYSAGGNWPSPRAEQICSAADYYNGNVNADAKGAFIPAFKISDLVNQLGSATFADRVCTYHNYKIHNQASTLFSGGLNSPQ